MQKNWNRIFIRFSCFHLHSLLFRSVFIARKTFNIREKELDKYIFPNTELRNLFVFFCVKPLYISVSPPILITVRLIQVFAELIITLSDSTCGLLERELKKILIAVSKYSKIHLLSLLSKSGCKWCKHSLVTVNE